MSEPGNPEDEDLPPPYEEANTQATEISQSPQPAVDPTASASIIGEECQEPSNQSPTHQSNVVSSPTSSPTSSQAAPPQGPRQRRRQRGPKILNVDALNWAIHSSYVQKNFETCQDFISHQLKQTKGQCEYAHYIQGHLHRHSGNLSMSLQAFKKAMHLNPHRHDNGKQVARSLFLMGRHRSSIKVYEQIINAGVRDWHITYSMGVAYSMIGELQEAVKFLEESMQLQKHDIIFLQLAKVQLRQGNLQGAVNTLETALKFAPENADVLTTLGLLYLDMGESKKSFDLFGTSLMHDSTNPNAILGAASILQKHDEYDVALVKYRLTTETAPDSHEVWNNVGMCFFGKGKLVAAIACLKRALYLSPLNWKICYNLGLVHLHGKQYMSAFQFISASVNLNTENAMSYMLLGSALMYLDDYRNAEKAFVKAQELDGANPLIHANFAALLYNSDDFARSSEMHSQFEKSLENSNMSHEIAKDVQKLSDAILTALQLGV
eukprot:m.164527 g.164527  ORF g.164527 m.164527 type:complete len:493 (-) comp15239_c0_seq1:2538-4016(-)